MSLQTCSLEIVEIWDGLGPDLHITCCRCDCGVAVVVGVVMVVVLLLLLLSSIFSLTFVYPSSASILPATAS